MLGRSGAAVLAALFLAPSPTPRPVPSSVATPSPVPTPSAEARLEFCSLLRKCALAAPDACTDALSRGAPGVDYDDERCGPARELSQRGVDPTQPSSFRVYRFLGERYQVVYRLDGDVPLSEPRLTYLLEDLPLAAALLSHFQKTPYEVTYLDPPTHRRIKGRRGDNLEGDATLLAGSPGARQLVYFGRGTSRIGPWKMRGLGLVQLRYEASGATATRYRIEVVAAPLNAVVNLMMKTGIFRRILLGQIREILNDIGEASAKLEKQGVAEGAPFSAQQRDSIAVLLRLP
jgi:hypothetical protein